MRWPKDRAIESESVGVSERLELCFERLIVLAFDLQLGLEFLDLQLEARNFGAELGEVGADRSLL